MIKLDDFKIIGNPGEPPLSREFRMVSTIPSRPGDSGSPIINENKEVLGVAVSSENNTHNAIIVKLSHLKEFISKHLGAE